MRVLKGIAHSASVCPSAKGCMSSEGMGVCIVYWSVILLLSDLLLSATGAQVALLTSAKVTFRVKAIWRGIFPISLLKRGFNFLAWDQQPQLRPVVFAKLSSHLLLPTFLGDERGRS